MSDLGTSFRSPDRDSTVAGTRPSTPKNGKSGEANEKGVPTVITRTSSYTDTATVDDNKTAAPTVDESRLLSGSRLALVHIGFLTSILLVALDQTIVATALPKLASQFQASVPCIHPLQSPPSLRFSFLGLISSHGSFPPIF